MVNKEQALSDLFAVLKKDFIEQLKQQSFELEQLVLSFREIEESPEKFDRIFRIVHNLKGAGGTYGLPLVTSICHLFEDYLSEQRGSLNFNKRFVDITLKFVDLLGLAATGDSRVDEKITNDLNTLRESLKGTRVTVMLLEASKTMTMLFTSAFSDMPVQLLIMSDGMQALRRLLEEPVDVIIASNNMCTLNSVAVVSAIKANAALNANTPVLFYGSRPSEWSAQLGGKFFAKNIEIAQQLAAEIEQVMKR